MMISRRGALLGGVCLATVIGGLRFVLQPGAIKAHAQQVIARVYGSEIAEKPATEEFTSAYENFLINKGMPGHVANAIFNLKGGNLPYVKDERAKLDRSIVVKFATSTNVVLSTETGSDLEFFGIFHPITNSCINQLSHNGLVWAEPIAQSG